MTTGEGGMVAIDVRRGVGAPEEPLQPGTGRLGGWLDARPARLQLPPRRALAPRSASPRSSGSTRSSRRADAVAARYATLLAGIDGVERAAPARRRAASLVVRLRRHARARRSTATRSSPASPPRGSPRSRTCPRSTSSRTSASGSASARGCCRSPRTRAAARSRSRSLAACRGGSGARRRRARPVARLAVPGAAALPAIGTPLGAVSSPTRADFRARLEANGSGRWVSLYPGA